MEERLQKVLASAGVASRREAEKIILAGRVKVNGKLVTELGTKVDPSHCRITVDGNPVKQEKKVYYIFNKPRGIVTTMSDEKGRKCISDFVKDLPERVFAVGRLDYNTEGLLLLTNDGELSQKLMHPSHEVNKTYLVKVPGMCKDNVLDKLRMGVPLEDGMTAPAIVNLRGYDTEGKFTMFDITIHEGRNRQVRRMCDYIGFPVRELKRIKLGPIKLQNLGRGKFRPLYEEELEALLKAAKI